MLSRHLISAAKEVIFKERLCLCLSVSVEVNLKMYGWILMIFLSEMSLMQRNNLFNFCDDSDPNPETGILKIILQHFAKGIFIGTRCSQLKEVAAVTTDSLDIRGPEVFY